MRESVHTLTSEVSDLTPQIKYIGLGLDDSLEPRKISQGMVGQVSIKTAILTTWCKAQSKKVSWYHPKHDQRGKDCW